MPIAKMKVKDADGVNRLVPIMPDPVERAPFFQVVNNAGVVPAGSNSVTIANTGDKDGTVLGKTLRINASVSWSANGLDTIGAIAYDASDTEFTIVGMI